MVHNRWVEKQTDFVFLNFFLKLFSFFSPLFCMQTVFWTQHLSIYMLQLMHGVCTALDSTQWLVASAEVCREHCFCDAVCFSFCECCGFVPICFLFLTVSLDGDFFLILQKVECLPEISKFYFVRLAISCKNYLI